MTMPTTKDTDKGYAWVILMISFAAAFVLSILFYTTGVIYVSVLEHIDQDLSRASWVGSSLMGTFTLLGPFAGMMTNKFGCRVTTILGGIFILAGMTGASFANTVPTLIVSYGLVSGLGVGFALNATVVISGHYFEKRRALASGIVFTGMGLGLFAGSPFVQVLLDTYSLSGAFLLLGSLGSHSCVFGMLMRPSPIERQKMREYSVERNEVNEKECFIQHKHYETESPCLWEDAETSTELKTEQKQKEQQHRERVLPMICQWLATFKNGAFTTYLLTIFFWSLAESTSLVHLINYASSKGTLRNDAANLFTAMGVTSLFSRFLMGFAGGDPAIGGLLLHTGSMGILSILTMTFPLYPHTFQTQMLFAAAYGMYSGGPNSLLNPITVQLLGVSNLATGYGLVNFASGIGYFTGPPLAGAIASLTKTYDHVYIFGGIMFLLSSLITLTVPAFHKLKVSDDFEHKVMIEEMPLEKAIPHEDDRSEESCEK